MEKRDIKMVLVIGNGFDLNLKLKTKYSDFAKSDEWKELYNQESVVKQSPLLQFLYGKSFIDQWYDIERALYEYSLIKSDGTYPTEIENDRKGYHAICDSMCKYLKEHVHNSSHSISSTSAGQLLKKMCNSKFIDYRIYSFNYTPVDLYFRVLNRATCIPEIINIHGGIEANSIILGVENVDIRKLAPGYSFLFKSNNIDYKSTDFVTDIEGANEVIIFGHSLNDFDFVYFKDYITNLLKVRDKRKRLTIVTYDEDSRMQILNNIRRQGFSIVDLFQFSLIDSILSSKIEDKDSSDYVKFHNLLERIR